MDSNTETWLKVQFIYKVFLEAMYKEISWCNAKESFWTYSVVSSAVSVPGEIWLKLFLCGFKSFCWKGDEWQPWPHVQLIPEEQRGATEGCKKKQSKTEHLETCSLPCKTKIAFRSQGCKNSFNLLLPFLALWSYGTAYLGPELSCSGKKKLLPESSPEAWDMLGLKQRDELVGREAKALVLQPARAPQHEHLKPPPISKWMFSVKTHDPPLVFRQVSFPTNLLPE